MRWNFNNMDTDSYKGEPLAACFDDQDIWFSPIEYDMSYIEEIRKFGESEGYKSCEVRLLSDIRKDIETKYSVVLFKYTPSDKLVFIDPDTKEQFEA